jgi:hypothetical protein
LLKNKDFGVLKKRTLLHLRFFRINKKISANQAALKASVEAVPGIVKLKINGIPQFSPVSYIADLLEECGLSFKNAQAIRMS